MLKGLFGMLAQPAPPPSGGSDTALSSMRSTIIAAGIVVTLFFGGLGGWAAVASLASATMAPGEVTVESNRKTVQHLEGGIVSEILVADGARVKAGQPLIRLDETQARSILEQLRQRERAALAVEARWKAERDALQAIVFPPSLDGAEDPKVAEVLAGERSIFEARRAALRGRAGILEQRIGQLEEEIQGLQGQIRSESRQLELIRRELSGLQKLRARQLASVQRVLELQRQEAEVEGARGRHIADIARAKQNIAEERLRILELNTTRVNEAVAALRETQNSLLDLSERIRAAADVLARTVIRSPLDGLIVKLSVHTIGGVVGPGQSLMDIVPVGERLVVEARVKPEDIDAVHPGLTAQVTVTAFSRRTAAPLEGTVVSVSADRLTDSRTGLPYFLARISLPEDGVPEGEQLFPGMQAEVMIVTGERTALGYMFRPVADSFNRALREE